ncbi:nitrate- and nitrite sensing domain-containing protein, partial [Streptomyces sp. MS19]|uniref:sensor histidine kinase n=1 Tax=Streptomyces sp. MS19 TaxID=3385972 RepID=UPI0039A004B2
MQGRLKREGSAAGDAGPGGVTDREAQSGTGTGDSPAPAAPDGERPPADGSPEAGPDKTGTPAPQRPSAAGSRLALRNWRISTRLVSLIALPVVAATILGGFRLQNSMANIEQLDDMQLLTEITENATLLAAALQEERDRSVGPLITGEPRTSDEVAGPRESTDSALERFSNATLRIDNTDSAMAGISATVTDIGRQLNDLSSLRNNAFDDPDYVSQTISQYNGMITALLSLSQDMAQATGNGEMIRSTRALAAFSAAKEHASIQRAVITAGLARDQIPGDTAHLSSSDWRYGRTSQRNEDVKLDTFQAIYQDRDRAAEMLEPLSGGMVNISAATSFAAQVFSAEEGIAASHRTYRSWFEQDRDKIDAMNRIEQQLLDEMIAQARSLQEEAENDAIINGAVVLLVLGLSLVGAFVVARSMVRSLRRLQATAQEVAHKRLPEVVRQMSEAEPEDVNTSVEPIGVYTRDEIGRVAEAFDDVHREAVRLAGEQALLRGNVNAMFTNLSRRSQGLIQRQLSLISELESREADPDQLSSLFKLDHLATRMRRNGENLLALAGEEPGRRWTRPVPLVDVLRAAASEVEQYERIELSAVPKTDVAGRVVNDLVHLLAELLENATSFSSPQTKVKVTGHALPDGRVLVEIHDTGIGLSPEDLAEINDRLANPPTVDVSVSRRMGLFVVGRLSLRHGIRIQLRPSDSGGTTALVMLPADVAQDGIRPRPAAGAGGAPTATLHREPPPVRRPAAEAGRLGPGRIGDTSTAPGRRSLGGPADEPRHQVGGAAERPALPPRSAGAPTAPQAPAQAGPPAPPPASAPTDAPAPAGAPGAGRPSWATSVEDSGRIPVARAGQDQPRGHDELSTSGQFPAVQPGGYQQPPQQQPPAQPGRSAMADAFAARQARAAQGLPDHDDDPSTTGRYAYPQADQTQQMPQVPQGPVPPAPDGRNPSDTGEFPAPQQYGAPYQDPGYQREADYRRPQGYQQQDRAYQEPAYQDPGYAQPAAYGEPAYQDRGGYDAGSAYQDDVFASGAQQAQGYRDEPAPQQPAPRQEPQRREPPRQQDGGDVHTPLSARQFPRTSERTPIFEEMETTWFGLRHAPAPPDAPSSGEQESSPQQTPQNPPPPPRPAQPGPQSGARHPAQPPAPRREPAGDAGGTWRTSPNDERWRQAEQLRQPSAGGVTTSGLPRRVPRANLVAGAAQQHQQAAPAGPSVSRRPDDVRGRLTNLRRGIQQGRQAGNPPGRPDRGFGPTYQ